MVRRIINNIKTLLRNYSIKKEGGLAFSETIRKYYKDNYNIIIGYGTYGGCFNTVNIPEGTSFGNYCSIAQNVKIFRANHPKEYFTLHPLFYNPLMGYVKKDMLHRPKIEIGHDVWIGDWVIILPKVSKIGNGAIIGAGSVVTKDVPAYSIVSGNPAKIIGMRFQNEIINKMENSQWWNWNKDELIHNKSFLENLVNEE
jgi:virginiamycin A acetyltransferase